VLALRVKVCLEKVVQIFYYLKLTKMIQNSEIFSETSFTRPRTYLRWSLINMVFFSFTPIVAILIGAALVFSLLTKFSNKKQYAEESITFSSFSRLLNKIATIFGIMHYIATLVIIIIYFNSFSRFYQIFFSTFSQ